MDALCGYGIKPKTNCISRHGHADNKMFLLLKVNYRVREGKWI